MHSRGWSEQQRSLGQLLERSNRSVQTIGAVQTLAVHIQLYYITNDVLADMVPKRTNATSIGDLRLFLAELVRSFVSRYGEIPNWAYL